MHLLNLPDNMLRTIVEKSSRKNAAKLKTVSRELKRIVEESTHQKNLPIPRPSYDDGTGRYQHQYEEIQGLDPIDMGPPYFDNSWTTRTLMDIYGPGGIIRQLRYLLLHDDEEPPLVKKVIRKAIRKLRTWKSERYKLALKRIEQKRDVTAEEDAESGHWAFDAIVMTLHDFHKRNFEYVRILKGWAHST
jgi:hypothetical protein